MSSFAKRLKEARLAAGISQEKLGVLAGIDEMSASARMNQYERGKHMPDISMVERLAEVLGVPRAYFYVDEDDIADLLVNLYRMKQGDRKKVMQYALQFVEEKSR
jgi:transcriptional regulator with XRE-family HTH domain